MLFENTQPARSKKIFLLLLAGFLWQNCRGMQLSARPEKSSIAVDWQLFSRIHVQPVFSESSGRINFNLERTLINIQKKWHRSFALHFALDSYAKHDHPQLQRTLYVKRAYLTHFYSSGSISAGLLVLTQFRLQRSFWKLRFIDKTFQNRCKYGENRGVGILFRHSFSPEFQFDLTFLSGYSTPMSSPRPDPAIQAGQTFKKNNWTFRFFNRLEFSQPVRHVHSLFIALNLTHALIGTEMAIDFNREAEQTHDFAGYSLFARYMVQNSLAFFARLDLHQNISIASPEEYLLLTGTEYKMSKQAFFAIYLKKTRSAGFAVGLGINFQSPPHSKESTRARQLRNN